MRIDEDYLESSRIRHLHHHKINDVIAMWFLGEEEKFEFYGHGAGCIAKNTKKRLVKKASNSNKLENR